jgi:bacteriocin biosynthesis cyclodehydratase domain-containing protein
VRDVNGDAFPTLPYLAPWYRVATSRQKVLLEYGQRIVCLEGGAAKKLVPALLPLLDGTRTVGEIVGLLGEPVRSAVEHALRELAAAGVLRDGPPLTGDVPRPVAGVAEFLASLRPGREPLGEMVRSVAACAVAVVGGSSGGVEVARLLRRSGVVVERAQSVASGVDLVVCAPAASELPLLAHWNEEALEARQPWLQILPFDGRYGAVGPLYLPGDTCCYECFRLRRAANLDAPDEFALLDGTPAPYPAAPTFDAIVSGVAAELALHWLVLGDHYAPAAFYALELLPTLALAVHHVHRVPRCPACSGLADVASPLPWYKEVPVGDRG